MSAVTILETQALNTAGGGAASAVDLRGYAAPLRVTVSVTAIDAGDPPRLGRHRHRAFLDLSLEHSADGSDWTTLHEFKTFTEPTATGIILGAFQPYVRARYALRSMVAAQAPSATFAIAGDAPALAAGGE